MTKEASQEVRAAEEVEAEIEEKKEEIQEVIAEPNDNAERSQLGRKVKSIETTLMGELTALRAELAEIKAQPKPEIDPEAIATVADIDERLEQREKEKQDAHVKYQNAYTHEMGNLLATLDEKEMVVVQEEMLENFDNILSNNPRQDAKTNFLSAHISVLKQAERKNPLKGETPQGINNGSKVKGQKKKDVPLSEDANKFVTKYGKSQEWIDEAMSGEA